MPPSICRSDRFFPELLNHPCSPSGQQTGGMADIGVSTFPALNDLPQPVQHLRAALELHHRRQRCWCRRTRLLHLWPEARPLPGRWFGRCGFFGSAVRFLPLPDTDRAIFFLRRPSRRCVIGGAQHGGDDVAYSGSWRSPRLTPARCCPRSVRQCIVQYVSRAPGEQRWETHLRPVANDGCAKLRFSVDGPVQVGKREHYALWPDKISESKLAAAPAITGGEALVRPPCCQVGH